MGFEQVDLFGFSMGGMIAQEIVLMEPQLVRKMILAGTGPAGGEGTSTVARVTSLDIVRGFLSRQDPKQFLFFIRTPGGIRAGEEFLARLKERPQNRNKEATLTRAAGAVEGAAPSHSDLIIYPDSGHGAVFQFHADCVVRALEFLAR
jgi:pimeloyl-ACP methyl ester carboxylesterase